MIYLNKILPVLVSPLVLAAFLVLFGYWKRRASFLVAGLLSLYLLSIPAFANKVLYPAAEGFRKKPLVEATPINPFGVLLGGGCNAVITDTGLAWEWSRYERANAAFSLYEAGKIQKLIITDGRLPWEKIGQIEGHYVLTQAKKRGIPDSALILIGPVENTEDEANIVFNSIGNKPITLVSSAFHMSRSRALFEGKGMVVTEFPVDFGLDENNQITAMSFLPTAKSLAMSEIALREFLGRLFYWLKGH